MPEHFEDRLLAAISRATPGPWGRSLFYLDGERADLFGEGKCSYCRNSGEPVVRGRFNINGKRMPGHIHVGREFTVGGFEGGGVLNPDDATLIFLLRNRASEIAALVEAARGLKLFCRQPVGVGVFGPDGIGYSDSAAVEACGKCPECRTAAALAALDAGGGE